jgi:hypothetical protein
MATIGKLCLTLTVIGLAVISLYLLPAVGKSQNDVAQKLRTSEEAVIAATEQHQQASMDLLRSSSRLAQLQIGWDKSWNIQQAGNSGVVVQGARLAVSGLGSDTGLIFNIDEDGQPAPPAVHAFKAMPEGGMYYVGEFVAEEINANSTTLIPSWQATQEEVEVWLSNPDTPWRFRTLIPAAARLRVDRLNVQLQDLLEKYSETAANVARQKTSLDDALAQLELRKQELIGGVVGAQPNEEFPELTLGLTEAVRMTEDKRNDLLVQIDELRRMIKTDSEQREAALRRLQELSERLPSADDPQISQSGSIAR